MYPYLPLTEVELDAALVRRLPRHVAYFHLALPVAEDENGITVAMAQPDNRLAQKLVESALGHAIVPVRSGTDEIQAALDRVWQDAGAVLGGAWAWTERADSADALLAYVQRAAAPAVPYATVQLNETRDVTDLIAEARAARPALLVAHTVQPSARRALLTGVPSAVWLTREIDHPPRRILVPLRGNMPDRQLLDWLPPLARAHQAEAVILSSAEPAATPSGNPLFSRFAAMLSPDDPRGVHLQTMRESLAALDVQGRLRVREGSLGEVITAELSENPYDLMLMAAEAFGDFAADLLEHIWERIGGLLLLKAG